MKDFPIVVNASLAAWVITLAVGASIEHPPSANMRWVDVGISLDDTHRFSVLGTEKERQR